MNILSKCLISFAMCLLGYNLSWLYLLSASVGLKNWFISRRSKVLSLGTLVHTVPYLPADFVPPQNIVSASRYPTH